MQDGIAQYAFASKNLEKDKTSKVCSNPPFQAELPYKSNIGLAWVLVFFWLNFKTIANVCMCCGIQSCPAENQSGIHLYSSPTCQAPPDKGEDILLGSNKDQLMIIHSKFLFILVCRPVYVWVARQSQAGFRETSVLEPKLS